MSALRRICLLSSTGRFKPGLKSFLLGQSSTDKTDMAGYIANAVLLATVCLIGGLVYATIYNLYISPLKVYPGPVSHAISRLPLDIARLRGNHHKHLRWLHDKYGPVARVAPGEVSTIKGKSWAEIYGPRIGRLEMPKADLGHRLNGVHGILTAPTRGQHRRQRRMLAHAFSAQGLREQENRINHFVNLLMVGLTERANIAPVDMAEWFHWTSFGNYLHPCYQFGSLTLPWTLLAILHLARLLAAWSRSPLTNG